MLNTALLVRMQGQTTATALPQAAAVVLGCSKGVKQCSSQCGRVSATEQMPVDACVAAAPSLAVSTLPEGPGSSQSCLSELDL